MFSPFQSRKEARRYAIAWLLSAVFLFVAEYSYSIVLHIPAIDYLHFKGLYIYTYDPFYLWSIRLPNGDRLGRYLFDASNMPITIVSTWMIIKVFAGWDIYIVRFPAVFVIDWALTCCFYVGRDIDKFEAGETNIIFVSGCVALVQFILYKYRYRIRRLFAPYLIHLQSLAFRLRK